MSKEALPDKWATTQIGDILTVIRGASPRPKGDPRYFGGQIPWISIRDINAEKGKFLTTTVEGVTELGAQKSRLVPRGNLILSNSGSVCIPKILKVDGCIHDGFVTFPDLNCENLSTIYFYHLFDWMRPLVIDANRQGVTQVNLNTGIVKAFEIPLPPLAEQKEIASRLDALLGQVERLKARVDALPAVLKRFRQSVLAAAVSGKLTEDWREENEAGNKNWALTPIADIAQTIFDGPFGSKLKTSDYTDSGIRVVRLGNIGHLEFKDGDRSFISREKYETLRSNTLKEGDILFSSFVDEEIRICRLPPSNQISINKADCFCIRIPNSDTLCDFVTLKLASHETYSRIKKSVHGVTRPRINLKFLRSFEIEIPPPAEQTEIVRRVNELFAFADKVEAQVSAAQARINQLSQSILAKAFRGELTADWRAAHPERITGEHSAEALLARIQAERATSKPAKKKRVSKAAQK